MVRSYSPGRILAAAVLLLDRAEDVEELPDAVGFALAGDGMEPRERRAHKARGGGEVAGQSQRAHAAAVERERERVGKEIFRLLRREVHEVVEREHLLREGRLFVSTPAGSS